MQLLFRTLRQLRMKRWWSHAQRALEEENLEEAARGLKRCVGLVPLWVPARLLYGTVLARKGELKEAEEQLKMGAELQPRHPEGHLQLGLFYGTFFPDRAEDATASLKKAFEFGPELVETIEADPRLRHLRADPRFARLVQEAIAESKAGT